MNEQNTPAEPNGERGNEPSGSLQTILSYARQNYAKQFVTLEAYRARAGSLLAFAAVLVAISAGSASRDAPSLFQAGGTVLVLGFNQRILGRRRAMSSVGLLCLVAGTILIGARVTGLLL